MPVDRTGVFTAAMAASEALDLLAAVLKASRSEDWEAAKRTSQQLREAAGEDVAAYNRFLASGPAAALRDTIEIPMRAARAIATGIELCTAARGMVKRSMSADVGVAAELLRGSLRGILGCIDANLDQTPADLSYETLRAERRELGKLV